MKYSPPVKRHIIGGVPHSRCAFKNCRTMVPDPEGNRKLPKNRYCKKHLREYQAKQNRLRKMREQRDSGGNEALRQKRNGDPRPEDFTAENRDGIWEPTRTGEIPEPVKLAMLSGDFKEFMRLTEPCETDEEAAQA